MYLFIKQNETLSIDILLIHTFQTYIYIYVYKVIQKKCLNIQR